MSTLMEDRLTAALRARADLVQPEDLQHHSLQRTRSTPLWRRPVVIALVAAAAVAAIVVPLALRGDNTTEQPLKLSHHWPPAPHHGQPTQKLTDHLTGDVDGDGIADQIRESGHTLTVTLAADPAHPLTQSNAHLGGLVGLADIGGGGQAILESVHDLTDGVEWQAIALRNGHLRLVLLHRPREASSLAVVPGYWTSWLTPQGVAMTGQLDPMQKGERHLAVLASRVEARAGRSVVSPVGRWCWDVVTQDVPAPCPDGVDNAFDPGSHGSLPALLPRFSEQRTADRYNAWQQGSTSLRLVKDPEHAQSVFHQVFDVLGTIDGHDVSARAGVFGPTLFKTFVDLGHGVRGLAVDNIGAEQSWTLLSFVDGKLVRLPISGGLHGLHPGTQVVPYRGKGQVGVTWIGPDGQVFTSLQTGGPGQDELFEWQVTDGSGTELTAVDLGRLCMDDYWGTYGTCAR